MTRGGVVGAMARRPCKALPAPRRRRSPRHPVHVSFARPCSDMRAVALSLNPTSSCPEIRTPPVPRLIVPDQAAVTRSPPIIGMPQREVRRMFCRGIRSVILQLELIPLSSYGRRLGLARRPRRKAGAPPRARPRPCGAAPASCARAPPGPAAPAPPASAPAARALAAPSRGAARASACRGAPALARLPHARSAARAPPPPPPPSPPRNGRLLGGGGSRSLTRWRARRRHAICAGAGVPQPLLEDVQNDQQEEEEALDEHPVGEVAALQLAERAATGAQRARQPVVVAQRRLGSAPWSCSIRSWRSLARAPAPSARACAAATPSRRATPARRARSGGPPRCPRRHRRRCRRRRAAAPRARPPRARRRRTLVPSSRSLCRRSIGRARWRRASSPPGRPAGRAPTRAARARHLLRVLLELPPTPAAADLNAVSVEPSHCSRPVKRLTEQPARAPRSWIGRVAATPPPPPSGVRVGVLAAIENLYCTSVGHLRGHAGARLGHGRKGRCA